MGQKILLVLFSILLYSTLLTAQTNDGKLTTNQITQDIARYLEQQNYNSEISSKLADAIVEDTLYWNPPQKDIKEADYIIGFSFGNRINKKGNRLPGPMNQQIADVIVKLYKTNPLPVYAQWEVAECIGDRIPNKKVNVIYPKITKTGDVVYLSTVDVAEDIIKDIGKDKVAKSNFIVAAFREHSPRCVIVCQKYGLKNSFIPENFELPDKYDTESGQPWTRDKFKYMIYDMECRLDLRINN